MLGDVLFLIYFFLPASFANMAPIFAKRWGWLDWSNVPIDAGKQWRGQRILGDHKTWRGLIAGVLIAVACALIQWWLYDQSQGLQDFYRIDISQLNPWLWGSALALGALGGDALKSFFKRQIGIAPGQNWVPFDQLDAVFGTMFVAWLLIEMPFKFYVYMIFIGLFLHPLINLLGWLLRLKENPF